MPKYNLANLSRCMTSRFKYRDELEFNRALYIVATSLSIYLLSSYHTGRSPKKRLNIFDFDFSGEFVFLQGNYGIKVVEVRHNRKPLKVALPPTVVELIIMHQYRSQAQEIYSHDPLEFDPLLIFLEPGKKQVLMGPDIIRAYLNCDFRGFKGDG